VTLTLKVKFADFQTVTRSYTGTEPFERAEQMLERAAKLLEETEAGARAVRLLGLTVSHLTTEIPLPDGPQLPLPFSDEG